jgi:hypothetical protein
MAPTAASLLTLAQLRAKRGALTEHELMHRCKDAARLELRGAMFSPDDRLDVAAQIMADGLAATGGSLPSATDPQHSLNAYCYRVKNYRRSIESARERDNLAAQAEQDRQAWSIDALTPSYVQEPEVCSPRTATEAADLAAWRLSQAPDSVADGRRYTNLWRYLYGTARDVAGPIIACELGLSPNAYDRACSRARVELRRRYPSAIDLLTALLDLGAEVRTDASRPAHERTHLLAHQWREGTDAGTWPTRPIDVAAARAVCEVRYRRAAPNRAAEQARRALTHRAGMEELGPGARPLSRKDKQAPGTAEQARTDALRRLGYALSR